MGFFGSAASLVRRIRLSQDVFSKLIWLNVFHECKERFFKDLQNPNSSSFRGLKRR